MPAGSLGPAPSHAIANRLLRLYAEPSSLDPSFTVLDRSDATDLMDLMRDELRLFEQGRRFPKKATCLAIYSYAVNARIELEGLLTTAFPWCSNWAAELKALFRAYALPKQAQRVLDYDDLLLYFAMMLASPPIAEDVASRFDFVLADEYQDTNALQAEILLKLKPDGRGLTVVGHHRRAGTAVRLPVRVSRSDLTPPRLGFRSEQGWPQAPALSR